MLEQFVWRVLQLLLTLSLYTASCSEVHCIGVKKPPRKLGRLVFGRPCRRKAGFRQHEQFHVGAAERRKPHVGGAE
jgi:hypothetical protein